MKEKKFWLLSAFVFIVVGFAWWLTIPAFTEEVNVLRQLNRLAAVLGFMLFLFQFLLSARVKIIEQGFGLDKMLKYHRVVGRMALGFLMLHPILWFVYEAQAGIPFFITIFRVIGIVSLLGVLVTASVASLYKKMNLPYELCLNIHKANYVLFPLVFVHVFANAVVGSLLFYIWISFAFCYAILVVYKLNREHYIRRNPYEVVEVKEEAKGVWGLSFKGHPFSYMPGQFMHLRLVRDGVVSSSHPFTLSSSPTREWVSVTAKDLGDFTHTLKETKVGDQAYIDAPYGVFSLLNCTCDRLVFIAGGIGITPFISMLRYMYDKGLDKQVTLFWGNKDDQGICFQDELSKMANEMDHFQLVYVMSRQEDWDGEKGRINQDLIKKYILDLSKHEYFVCGPPPMSRAAMDALQTLGIPKQKIHHEVFEL